MVVTFPFGETVVLLRSGEPVYDAWGAPSSPVTEITVQGVAVDPTGRSSENTDRQETVTVDMTIYPPADTDVRHTDRFRVRGDVFDVVGAPALLRSPYTGRTPAIEVRLRRSQ